MLLFPSALKCCLLWLCSYAHYVYIPVYIPNVPVRASGGISIQNPLGKLLQAPPDPDDPVWMEAKGRPVLLLRSGSKALDDATEAAFRSRWSTSPWRWSTDTSLEDILPDSIQLVFQIHPVVDEIERSNSGDSCRNGWVGDGSNCRMLDSGSIAYLAIVRPDGSKPILYHQYTEIPTRPEAMGMLGDLVKDFRETLERQWRDSIPNPHLLSNVPDWQNLVAFHENAGKCPACTLFVPAEYGLRGDSSSFSKAVGRPLRFLPTDSLVGRIGTPAQGLYLEAATRSSWRRYARVRMLSTGDLMAQSEWEPAKTKDDGHPNDSGKSPALDDDVFDALRNRLDDKEHRIAWDANECVAYAAGTLNLFGTFGLEVHRGVLAVLGGGISTKNGDSGTIPLLVAGMRYLPFMGVEASPMHVRLILDLLVLQPFGQYDPAQADSKAKTMGVAALTLHLAAFEIGAGGAWTIPEGKHHPFPLFVRLGIDIPGRLWKRHMPSLVAPR